MGEGKIKKIVIIGTDASRTGAPILLIRLLELLKPCYQINIVLNGHGPLQKKFEEIGKTLIYPQPYWAHFKKNNLFFKAISYYLQPFRVANFKFKLKTLVKNTDLYFVNTITNADILKKIKINKPVISYIHELEFLTKFYNSAENIRYQIDVTNLFLVPSETVKEHLVKNYSIEKSKIKILNYFLEVGNSAIRKKDIKELKNIQHGNFIVLGCGTTDWRKGFDLFHQTAYHLFKLRNKSDFHFIWVGGDHKSHFARQVIFDISQLETSTFITLISEVSNPLEYFQLADIFYLPSREDPYPVVVLEAAAFSIPCLCFDKGGGIVEFVEKDAGWITSYLDVREAALKINYLIESHDEIKRSGNAAKQKLTVRHGKGTVVSQLNSIFESI